MELGEYERAQDLFSRKSGAAPKHVGDRQGTASTLNQPG